MTRVLIVYCILSLIFISPLQAQEIDNADSQTEAGKNTEETTTTIQAQISEESERQESEEETPPTEHESEKNEIENTEQLPTVQSLASESNETHDDVVVSVATASALEDMSEELLNIASPSSLTSTASVSSHSATEKNASPSAQTDTQINNTAKVAQDSKQSVSTGSNKVDASEEAEITTATATAEVVTTTEVNTTIIGTDVAYGTDTIVKPDTTLDLSDIQKNCKPFSQATQNTVAIDNQADVINTISANAYTGSNLVQGETANITTGDAVAEANISTIANTTLVGNCWFYRVISIFTPTNNSIILPNEEQFVGNVPNASSSPQLIQTDQTATVSSDIQVTANTGTNSAESITTGSSHTNTEATTITNTALYGDSWFLFKVTNPHYWKGTLLGNNYITSKDQSSLYFWLPSASTATQPSKPPSLDTIGINNTASVTNNVELLAATGDNKALGGPSLITTGNAYTEVEILNLLNTSVIGNNWYFVMLNLFDTFEGDVTIARPDLAILTPSKITVAPGDTISYAVAVINEGNSPGHNVVLQQLQPKWHQDQHRSTTTWNIDSLANTENKVIPVHITIPSHTPDGTYTLSYKVSSSNTEHSLENNSSSVTITVQKPQVVETVQYIYSQPQLYTNPRYSYTSQPNYYFTPAPPASLPPQVLGTQDSEPTLTIPFPSSLNRSFCIKHWELCSAAGLLITAGPVKAIEKRKYFKFDTLHF